MACNTNLIGIPKGCDSNTGGIQKIYIIGKESVLSTTEVAGETTVIGLDTGVFFEEYTFNKGSASYTEDLASDLASGSQFYTVQLTMNIPRREVSKRQSIQLLASGQRELVIIILDGNGLYWLMGKNEGSILTASGEGSGAAKADGSKYSLTFLAEDSEMMTEVDDTIVAALLA